MIIRNVGSHVAQVVGEFATGVWPHVAGMDGKAFGGMPAEGRVVPVLAVDSDHCQGVRYDADCL